MCLEKMEYQGILKSIFQLKDGPQFSGLPTKSDFKVEVFRKLVIQTTDNIPPKKKETP